MNTRKRLLSALRLYGDFFRVGLFTFGGGWSIVAQLGRLYVDERGVLSAQELVDLTSVAKSMPGIMIVNASMIIGYHMGGYLSGLACMLGISTPPLLILSVVTWFYTEFAGSAVMAAAMAGVRAAVVPIVGYAALTMIRGSIHGLLTVGIALLSFVAYYFFGLGSIATTLLGAFCGLLAADIAEKRGALK